MAVMNSSHKRKTPEWLRPLWERKNAETAARISAGMQVLLEQNRPVTLGSVQQAILGQSGVKISQSTIQRSEAYRRQRRSIIRDRPTAELAAAINDLGPQDRNSLLAKASRLRRDNKEGLIAKILILESALSRQTEVERTLQKEILRLQFESMPYAERTYRKGEGAPAG